MNLRELKYVLIGDDRLSGKLRNVSAAGKSAADSLRNSSNRLEVFKRNFRQAADEIPGFSQGLRLARNPILLATGAVVGLGAGLNKAAKEAAKFNTNFRELANLNLDKSSAQIGSMKNMVLQSALEKGFDASKTSRGFYDVQSVTGMFGGQVAKVVEQQGEFANLMQADFNAWIEGTGKAMANYGFGAEQLQEFNRAAYATVKVGSITFDQLAKVQSAYAGAAASAGQSFSAANKMLTVFTIKTKSADEAATLTKSLFNDLTKKTTIDSMKKAGINVFDTSGKIKQADQLMLELNKKFSQLGGSDKNIINLKNQFMGSEGLIAFVQAATDQSGGLIRTLNDFDSTKFGLNEALALAKKDLNYINEQLKNKLNANLVKLGENLMPLFNKVTGVTLGVVEDLSFRLGSNSATQAGGDKAKKEFDYLFENAASLSDAQFDEGIQRALKDRSYFEKMVNDNRKDKGSLSKWTNAQGYYNYHYADEYISVIDMILRDAQKGRALGVNPVGLGGAVGGDGTTGDDSMSKGIDSITGGGNQIRNITVNITKLIENQNISTTNLSEGSVQIKEKVEEALIRAIAGTEQMLAS